MKFFIQIGILKLEIWVSILFRMLMLDRLRGGRILSILVESGHNLQKNYSIFQCQTITRQNVSLIYLNPSFFQQRANTSDDTLRI